MSLASNIFDYLAQALGGLFLFAIILRFFLQLARADFYNPISQGIVRGTNPLLIPMRRVVPGIFGIDIASLALALILQVVIGEINFFIGTGQFYNPLAALVFGLLGILKLMIFLGYGICIVAVVSSFIAPYSDHPVVNLTRQLLDPLSRPIQKILPPMGGLDFSIFFIFLALGVFNMIIKSVAFQLHLSHTQLSLLVIGL
ncbi:MAG: YggT family protein [Agarilytica sp.]